VTAVAATASARSSASAPATGGTQEARNDALRGGIGHPTSSQKGGTKEGDEEDEDEDEDDEGEGKGLAPGSKVAGELSDRDKLNVLRREYKKLYVRHKELRSKAIKMRDHLIKASVSKPPRRHDSDKHKSSAAAVVRSEGAQESSDDPKEKRTSIGPSGTKR